MSNVIPFDRDARAKLREAAEQDGRPPGLVEVTSIATGPAHCLVCSHEWVAVVQFSHDIPDQFAKFQCPNCACHMGVFTFGYERDEPHFYCNCGNNLFYATPTAIYCPACGNDVKPYE